MRILFLTHRLPYAPNRGDRIRAYHVLQALCAAGVEVDLCSLVHDAAEEAEVARLSTPGRSATGHRVSRLRGLVRAALALARGGTLTHALLDAPGIAAALQRHVAARRPDLVLAYCSGMARFALAPPLGGIPFVLDMVDVDSAKWAALAARSRGPLRWVYSREARLLARFEAEAARAARLNLVVHAREREALLALAPEARVEVVENGVDIDGFRPPGPPAAARTVVFCGVMSYAPNARGARWLAREVWPLVRARHPDARLLLVGQSPPRAVRALAARDPSVEVTGTVADVRPHLWSAAVAAAPLQVARGMQNKVLEALAAGLPCVVTPAVAAGLPAEAAPGIAVADEPAAFAERLSAWLAEPPEARRALAARADLAALAWARRLSGLPALLETAARGSGGP